MYSTSEVLLSLKLVTSVSQSRFPIPRSEPEPEPDSGSRIAVPVEPFHNFRNKLHKSIYHTMFKRLNKKIVNFAYSIGGFRS
jgi:hypothetical protein